MTPSTRGLWEDQGSSGVWYVCVLGPSLVGLEDLKENLSYLNQTK